MSIVSKIWQQCLKLISIVEIFLSCSKETENKLKIEDIYIYICREEICRVTCIKSSKRQEGLGKGVRATYLAYQYEKQ